MHTEGPIRVVLADDDQGYLESLRILIDRQPELAVVGAAIDGIELLDLVDRLDPDAAVIDLHMPRLDGVSAVERLRHEHPAMCLIALTGDGDVSLHAAVMNAGADGVLLKGELIERLVDRLSAVRAA
jgi:two-component system, NarL family, nitrate/nitrite response regulator NarL